MADNETELELTREELDILQSALLVGKKESTVYVVGHKVRLCTPTVRDELEIAQIIKDYVGTIAQNKAYKAALVAACIQSIDDEPLFVPVSAQDLDNQVLRKFDKLKLYYVSFVEKVYEHVLALDKDNRELLQKLGKVQG